jgi:hypothetical protein
MNDLETKVLELIGENIDDPDVFTDDSTGMAQIRESLNDAIEEVCMVTGSYKRKYFVAIQNAKNFYQITDDRDVFAWPTSVWLTVNKWRLERVDIKYLLNLSYRWMYDTGTPERYFLIGSNKIGVHPLPGSASYTLEIDAVAIPDRYTLDNDRIKIRDEYQWAVVNYAVSEYWASRGDAKSATDHFMRYLGKLNIINLYPESHEQQREFRTEKREVRDTT